ncbi:MAG: ZIP family metal transporter, partial [Turicibacter sanguinis]
FYFNQWRDAEGKNSLKRSLLLVSAVTIHNIPEGLAVGVAFGGVVAGIEGATLISAILLAIGIGLQNFPEGAAVSLPLRREGYSRWKSFLSGQASGLVEPVAGVIGALAAISVRSLLPFLLAFAAGAMISVVSSELIPESARDNKLSRYRCHLRIYSDDGHGCCLRINNFIIKVKSRKLFTFLITRS